VKERPIIFNTEMVKAILDGRKTVTRRQISRFPAKGYKWGGWIVEGYRKSDKGKATVIPNKNGRYESTGWIGAKCQFGQVGDRLYVRETFAPFANESKRKDIPINAHIDYKADFTEEDLNQKYDELGDDIPKINWEPSIHMPKKYARIWLEITDVRVERVQEIKEDQAFDEGVKVEPAMEWDSGAFERAQNSFKDVWNSIYKNWDSNPWVWVIEFKMIPPTEKN